MAPYERRLNEDMQKIEDTLTSIGEDVTIALKNSTQALLDYDRNLAYDVILGDKAVNRKEALLKDQCYQFIVKHLPAAGHLRFVSSVMEMASELERMGDYAVTICRESVQLAKIPYGQLRDDIKLISDESFKALEHVLNSIKFKDDVQTKNTFKLARLVPTRFDQIYESLIKCENWERSDLFAYLVIFNMYLRVADRTENICEELRFISTGKTKSIKIYNILFLDEDNSFLAPMAKNICEKLFAGKKDQFACAAVKPVESLDQGMVDFMVKTKSDVLQTTPLNIDSINPADYYIIVSLQGPMKSYIQKTPFHSIALEWDVEERYKDALESKNFEDIYRDLSSRIHDLMDRLYGEGWSVS